MLEIKTIKTENGEVGISFVIQTSKIKQKYSDVVSVVCSVKERVEQRLRLFRLAWQVLQADPRAISLEKNGKENQLSFSWQDKPKKKINNFDWKNFRICSRNSSHLLEILQAKVFIMAKKGHFVIQSNKKKIIKAATGISAVVLIICASIALMPFIRADELCAVDVDTILVIDTTRSMADGEAPSECKWWELQETDGVWGCKMFKEYNQSLEWCESKTDLACPSSIHTPAKNSKIDDTKTSAKTFIDNLGDNDQSSLVSLNDTASLISPLSNTHQDTQTAIDGLLPQSGTGTDIAGAIQAVIDEFDPIKSGRANLQAIKAAILLTDGKDPNTADVTARTAEAAALGYKIFTIGLGDKNKIDEPMLQSIASTTNAQYHYAANGSDLAGIYEEIAGEICQYGSISGCKYLDADADGDISNATTTLPNWDIILSGPTGPDSITTTQQTDETGCYTFAGLLAGEYTVSEILKNDWIQTYPVPVEEGLEGLWQVPLNEVDNKVENVIEKHFGNYYPCDDGNVCTDDSYDPVNSECVFTENLVECDDGDACTTDDICSKGSCLGIQIVCNDEDPCTTDACVDGECVYTSIVCDDGMICCDEGICKIPKCSSNSDCDDDRNCTIDICNDSGTCSAQCFNTNITTCGINDGCCPVGCNSLNDNDCDINCSNGVCEIGECNSCPQDCAIADCCGNESVDINLKDGDEDCDGSDGDGTCSDDQYECDKCVWTGGWCGDNIVQDAYGEDCDTSEPEICTTADGYIGERSCESCVWGDCVSEEFCGDGITNGDEECDDGNTIDGDGCSSVCQDEPKDDPEPDPEPVTTPPSGGGVAIIPHSILDVRPTDIVADSVTITWRTSFFATSQVIYSIEGETHDFDPDNPPMYGYAHITPEYDIDPKVTYHTVVIPELSPNQTYYYRTISRASPSIFSQEFTFTTLASDESAAFAEATASQGNDAVSETDGIQENDEPAFVPLGLRRGEEISLEEIAEKISEINSKVATIRQEVVKISPKADMSSFAYADDQSEFSEHELAKIEDNGQLSLLTADENDQSSVIHDQSKDDPASADAMAGEAKFLAGIGTFFSNLHGWKSILIFLLGIILALLILRFIKSWIGRRE